MKIITIGTMIKSSLYKSVNMQKEQRIFIIEGPDNTGKTHIAQRLSQLTSIPVFKRNLGGFLEKDLYSRKDGFKTAFEFDQTYIVDFLKQVKCSVIFDRCFPSEWVYSLTYKRERNEPLLKLIDEEYAKLNAMIIICLRKERNYDKFHDDITAPEYNIPLHENYVQFHYWTSCKNLVLFTDNEDVNKQVDCILTFHRMYS
jgi:hypothetical protein